MLPLAPETPALQIMASMPSGYRSYSSRRADSLPSTVARLAVISPSFRSMLTVSWPCSFSLDTIWAPMPLEPPVTT